MSPRPDEHSEDECGDGDSLFGSPPPSPQSTGRVALPGPSTSSGESRPSTATGPAKKHINVGTIALPGSQPDSEFPVNPLALSLSLGIVQRPPALQPAPAAIPAHISTSAGADARASTSQSLDLSFRRPPKSKKKPKMTSSARSSKESTPQPRMPEFTLPDPGAPPPSNFLRNQENLLGMAGRVAGVKPSTLTHTNPNPHSSTHTRGSTPSNPILVDEEDDTPILGRRRPPFAPGFTAAIANSQPYIDPALLTAPTNQEIVSVLIGQKDIFPILEGVLKLVVGSVPGGTGAPENPKPTAFERRTVPLPVQQQQYQTHAHRSAPPPYTSATTSTSATPTSNQPNPAPPKKRRKLSRVPAGATDWDVPYPFEQGEGPESYTTTWERERGKQLIGQLIKLIKGAARKAATKKYWSEKEKEEKERRRREGEGDQQRKKDGYYRVDGSAVQTQVHGQGQSTEQGYGQGYDVLQDMSNAAAGHIDPSALSTTNSSAYMQPNNTLGTTGTEDQHIATLEELFGACPSTSSTPVDSPLDFSIFNTYPEGLSASNSLDAFNAILSASSSSTGTSHNTLSNPDSSSTTTAGTGATPQTSAAMDQAAFDSWMNFLVDTFPTSFDSNNNGAAATNTNSASNSNSSTTIATTSNANANATQTPDVLNHPSLDPSNSTSHCSTPGPDEFSFASLFGGQGGATGTGGMGDYDLAAMLASIMNQPPSTTTTQPQGGTHAGAGSTMDVGTEVVDSAAAKGKENASSSDTAPPPIGDQMIDPTLLALSLPSTSSSSITTMTSDANKGLDMNSNINVDTSTPALASLPSSSSVASSASTSSGVSASGSGSISGNDPATPASASWDMSLPDVHMGGVGGGEGTGGGHGPDWERLGASGNDSAAMNVDGEDFGFLPDVDVDVGSGGGDDGMHTTTTTTKVDKGKGRAIDLEPTWTPTSTLTPLSTNSNTRTSTPAPPPSTTTSASAPADAQAAFRALLGGASSSSSAVNALAPTPVDATFTPSANRAALEAARLKRKARKDDIIARAQEKKRRLQEELDKVKMKLWETTIEQAALVHLGRRIDEEEKKNAEGVGGAGAGAGKPMEVMVASSEV